MQYIRIPSKETPARLSIPSLRPHHQAFNDKSHQVLHHYRPRNPAAAAAAASEAHKPDSHRSAPQNSAPDTDSAEELGSDSVPVAADDWELDHNSAAGGSVVVGYTKVHSFGKAIAAAAAGFE